MIFVCEPTVKGPSHEKVNSGFLACLQLAYPNERITLFADESHIAALRHIATVDGLDFSAVNFVAMHVAASEGPVQFLRYCRQLKFILEQVLAAGAARVLFLSSSPAVQLQAKWLQSIPRYAGLQLCFVLHAAFEAVATDKLPPPALPQMPGRSQRLLHKIRDKGLTHALAAAAGRVLGSANIVDLVWHKFTRNFLDVRRVMEWRHSDRTSYIALSPHIISNAQKYLDPASLNIETVVLPTVFRNFGSHVSTDYVRFAVFGYGNTPMLFAVMTHLVSLEVARHYEVRIVGMDNRGMSGFPSVNAVSPGKFMDRQEMERHVRDVDMFLILYDKSRYRLSCSNAIFEALSYQKPILHLSNECIDYFNSAALPIGYRAEVPEAFAKQMATIINEFPRFKSELEAFSRNIAIVRSKYSLERSAMDLKAALDKEPVRT